MPSLWVIVVANTLSLLSDDCRVGCTMSGAQVFKQYLNHLALVPKEGKAAC